MYTGIISSSFLLFLISLLEKLVNEAITLSENPSFFASSNISLDKFVDLDKQIVMKCLFINKFDSWKPIKISEHEISPRREIICYKKK